MSVTTSRARKAAAGSSRTEAASRCSRRATWLAAPRSKDVSFDVYRGEILALGGLVGAGRTEVARLAFGVDRLQGGHFEMNGKRLTIDSETQAIALGIALVPEERRSQGLMLEQSVAFNINIASLQSLRSSTCCPSSRRRKCGSQAQRLIQDLGVKTPSPSTRVASLSGGNQQKSMIARWLRPNTKILILDEPSRGVDIGAREEIHEMLRKLARSGVGVIVISSDVEELAILADRVVVMREGQVVGELVGDEITEARIVEMSYHEVDAQGERT